MYNYTPRNQASEQELQRLLNNAESFYPTMTGTATPVGAVTPQGIGQTFVDTAARIGYMAVGLTNADWLRITA